MFRYVRWSILVSVSVGALLAIVALLGGDFGETHAKIVGTAFSVTGAGTLVVAALSASEQERFGPIPAIGAGAAAAGFSLLIIGIWAEPDSEIYWKTTGTFLIVGAAVGLLGLLSLARLAPRYRWVAGAAHALTGILALYSIGLMWGEVGAQWAWRIFGTMSVLLASATVAVPVLHRASREAAREPAPGTTHDVRFCPICGAEVDATTGTSATCESCGTTFRVDVASDGSPSSGGEGSSARGRPRTG